MKRAALSVPRVETRRKIVALTFDDGPDPAALEEIANHSMHHDRMVFMSPSHIRAEVDQTDALIRAGGWRGPIVFRAPFGKKLGTRTAERRAPRSGRSSTACMPAASSS